MRYMRSLARVETRELLNPSYIGQPRNSILTRLKQHKQNESILEHAAQCHDINKKRNKIFNISYRNLENDSITHDTIYIRSSRDY